jgi:hypothetical protein
MLTPKDLYEMKSTATLDALALRGFSYDHVPEAGPDVELRDKPRVRVEVVGYVHFDHRRYWRLATVWFDDKPVMVVQNAGREGDGYSKRFVTDVSLLMELAKYLKAEEAAPDTVPLSYDGADLVNFYGVSLDEALRNASTE